MSARPLFMCAAALVSGALILLGCGSNSQQGSGTTAAARKTTSKKESNTNGCRPDPSNNNFVAGKRVEPGRSLTARFSNSHATVKVVGVSTPNSVKVLGKAKKFTPSKGSTIVAVTFHISNEGPGELVPRYDVGEKLLLQQGGEVFHSVEASNCDLPLSTSRAVEQGETSPQANLGAGDSATTETLFLAPNDLSGPMAVGLPAQNASLVLPTRE